MASTQSPSSQRKSPQRVVLTIGDRKKIRNYYRRSANITTRGLADWAALEFGRPINEQTCRQCIQNDHAFLEDIEDGSSYAQFRRIDSLKKAMTLDQTLEQLSSRPPPSLEVIRTHAEAIWAAIPIPTKGKPKFTENWMKEFADRFEERPEDPLPKQSKRTTRNEERAVPHFNDHAPEHEPTPPTAFDITLLSPYQRSLQRRRSADVRTVRSHPASATRPGFKTPSFVARRLQTQETTEGTPAETPALHVKRAHDELYSSSSDEDRPRHRKRFKQSLPPPHEEQTPDVPCSATKSAFRTPPCFCGRKDPVYKSSATQTDNAESETGKASQQPTIQSDQLMFCSFLEMTGRSLLMAFTELWNTDRDQYETFFEKLADCPTGDEDAIPYIISVLEKHVPRRADRTTAMSLARYFGHYGKDGIDAVQDWMAKIGGSTFGTRVKAEAKPQKSQSVKQSSTSTQCGQEQSQNLSSEASLVSLNAVQIRARLAEICALSAADSIVVVLSRQIMVREAFKATIADLERIFNKRIEKFHAAGQMMHARDARLEVDARWEFILQATRQAAAALDHEVEVRKRVEERQLRDGIAAHRCAWPGRITS